MTAREILYLYLLEHGYDGLCSGECGCDLNDLCACCGECSAYCHPAYKFDCDRCLRATDRENTCESSEFGEGYMMSVDKDFCHPVYAEVSE